MKRWVLTALMVVAALPGAAMAVEEPAFKEVLREGDFELRDYPALVAAEVTVAGDQKPRARDSACSPVTFSVPTSGGRASP